MNIWSVVFAKLNLPEKEKKKVDSFLENQTKTSLLTAAQILRRYHRVNESLELLSYGILSYPNYIALRIELARGLYEKGLIEDAWDHLQLIDFNEQDYLLAKEIYFFCSILLERESHSYKFFDELKKKSVRCFATLEVLRIDGLTKAKARLLDDFKNKGVFPVLPVVASNMEFFAQEKNLLRLNSKRESSQESLISLDFMETSSIENYRYVSTENIFSSDLDTTVKNIPSKETRKQDGLDLTSLAKIYEHQGHLEKSIGIYEQVLIHYPQNELAKKSLATAQMKLSEKSQA